MAFVTAMRLKVVKMLLHVTTTHQLPMLETVSSPMATVKCATAMAAWRFKMPMAMAFVTLTKSQAVKMLLHVTTMLLQQTLAHAYTPMATAKCATATAA